MSLLVLFNGNLSGLADPTPPPTDVLPPPGGGVRIAAAVGALVTLGDPAGGAAIGGARPRGVIGPPRGRTTVRGPSGRAGVH